MHSFIHAQALSVNLRKQTLDGASRNISRLNSAIDRAKVRLMQIWYTAEHASSNLNTPCAICGALM